MPPKTAKPTDMKDKKAPAKATAKTTAKSEKSAPPFAKGKSKASAKDDKTKGKRPPFGKK